MNKQPRNYQTQWATQFYAAAELVRHKYLVSLTFGNAKCTDILASSPTGHSFRVEVKGLATNNWWLIDRPPMPENLFYVLVYLPDGYKRPKICVLTAVEVIKEIDRAKKSILGRGRRWDERMEGIPFKAVFKYQNKWEKLPK
jgi:hypothetical protein